MKKQDIIKALQDNIDIPEIVQKKAEEAFAKIQLSAPGKADKEQNAGKREKSKKRRRFSSARAAVLIGAATLALAGITAAAAYYYWSRSLSEGLQITEEQKLDLEEEHAVAFVMQECSVQGVTVTAVQSITDDYFTHIVLRVEGYQLEQGAEPGFEMVRVTVDGKEDFNLEAGFYNGLITGADGQAAYADGSPLDLSGGERLGRYVMDDGSMEYWVTLSTNKAGYFVNKPVHVELKNLGSVAKADYAGGIEGSWAFDWNLQGTQDKKEYIMQEPLGDTGAVVRRVELSPISFHVEYDFPRKEISETGLDETGKTVDTASHTEPPMLRGVRLKDGTMYHYLDDGGSFGYESEDSDVYFATFALSRVIDVEQVESLLFIRAYPDNSEPLTEENYYVVPVL